MEDKRLEILFDHLTTALEDIYEYVCEKANKKEDDTTKTYLNFYEETIIDFINATILKNEKQASKDKLKRILNELDDILSYAYECEPDCHQAERINEVEDQLFDILKKKGMI